MALVDGPAPRASANSFNPFDPFNSLNPDDSYASVLFQAWPGSSNMAWEGPVSIGGLVVHNAELTVSVVRSEMTAAALYHPLVSCLLTEYELSDFSGTANDSLPNGGIEIDRLFPCTTLNGNVASTTNRTIRFNLPEGPGDRADDSVSGVIFEGVSRDHFITASPTPYHPLAGCLLTEQETGAIEAAANDSLVPCIRLRKNLSDPPIALPLHNDPRAFVWHADESGFDIDRFTSSHSRFDLRGPDSYQRSRDEPIPYTLGGVPTTRANPFFGRRRAQELYSPPPDGVPFERNVDPTSGRPRTAGNWIPDSCGTNDAFVNHTRRLADRPDSIEGVGTAAGCLKPGGYTGEENANGLGVDPDTGELRYGVDLSASPENALHFHHANQQTFSTLCNATLGIFSSLDPFSCAFSIFGSRQTLATVANVPVPLVEAFSVFLAGEPSADQANLNRIIGNASGATAVRPVPLVNLNRETAFAELGFSPGNNNVVSYAAIADAGNETFRDVLTLDSTLTREQRALLGCGPFWGTRCDSAADRFDPDTGEILYRSEAGGGLDFLNADAGVMLSSFPGSLGTNFPGLNGLSEGQSWTTTGRGLQQAGTIGFSGGLIATAYTPDLDFEGESGSRISGSIGDRHVVSDRNGIVHLPGSRGVITPYDLEAYGYEPNMTPYTIDTTRGSEKITFIMQEGYNPMIDGCIFGPSMTDAETGITYTVDAVMLHTATGTLVPIARSISRFCGSEYAGIGATTRFGDQLRGGIQAPIDPDTGLRVDPVFIDDTGAATTLWHPIAGCLLTEKEASDLTAAANASSLEGGIEIDPLFPCVTPNGAATNTDNRLIRFDLTDLPGYSPGDSLFDLDAKNGTLLAPACGLFISVGTTVTCGRRDHDTEFIQGALRGVDARSQIFQNELAALSWNLLQLLVITSCETLAACSEVASPL